MNGETGCVYTQIVVKCVWCVCVNTSKKAVPAICQHLYVTTMVFKNKRKSRCAIETRCRYAKAFL
jgi:hypothetical protein